MKSFLVCGVGLFGLHIIQKLNELDQEIMAIDNSEERVNSILPYTTNSLIGDTTNEEFMQSIGVGNFDVCFVCIGDSFQDSVVTTSLLRDFGAKTIVARASNDVHAKFLLRNGADKVIYPEKQLAEWAAMTFSSNHILDYIELDNDYSIFEVIIPPEWDGKTIGDIKIRQKYGINVLGLKTNKKLQMNVTPDTYLVGNSSMLVLGTFDNVKKCFHI